MKDELRYGRSQGFVTQIALPFLARVTSSTSVLHLNAKLVSAHGALRLRIVVCKRCQYRTEGS